MMLLLLDLRGFLEHLKLVDKVMADVVELHLLFLGVVEPQQQI